MIGITNRAQRCPSVEPADRVNVFSCGRNGSAKHLSEEPTRFRKTLRQLRGAALPKRKLIQKENAMHEKSPSNEPLRKKGDLIDQRQQQSDPAGKHRVDPNEAAKRSQKQPGQDLRDPQKGNDDAD